ncbi:MAG: HAMP domain-containing histidine kinase [Lachnospiraceae bacterium]|nr:HAMP domain-containing histidine kinase [Lachnospiraceae bacterium]
MKLKKKIIAACALIAILPMILGVCIGGIIVLRQFNKMTESYDVTGKGLSIIQDPMIAYNSMIRESVEKIENKIESEPDKLTDIDYLTDLNETLNDYSSTVYVTQNGGYIFKGDSNLLAEVEIYFPEYGSKEDNSGSIYINTGKSSVLIEYLEFERDGDEFSMYLTLEIDKFLPEIRNGATQLVLALVIILILVGVLTLLWLYKLFISPLTRLNQATHEIMEGNLDFSLKTNRMDEIGQLQNDFDDMRIHLKETTEQILRNAETSKEMMSNVSHDLKTPLTAIKGYTEGLMDGVADTPEKQQRYLKTIYTKACDMEKLVEDLSYFSRLDNKTITYNFAKVNLKEFIRDCVEDMAMDVEVMHISLKESYQCGEDVNVIIDSNEVKRVLLNIIGNSIKYMDKDEGVICIRVLNDEDFAWITIEDNGRGMDAKDIPHVFERFYRADSSRGTRTGGTGLGLAIAKSIIEAHGGTITANSVKGVGTSIRFSLPCEKTKEATYE